MRPCDTQVDCKYDEEIIIIFDPGMFPSHLMIFEVEFAGGCVSVPEKADIGKTSVSRCSEP